MKIIKNKLFIAFLAFSLGNNLQSMEPEKTFPFSDLPLEIQLMSATSAAPSLRAATDRISALAVANKELNQLLNDPVICLKIIKNLAKQFGCSDQAAAEALGTQEAKNRLHIQKQFFDLCNQAVEDFNQEDFDALYKIHEKYVDLNFTYYTPFEHEGYEPENIETILLMIAIMADNCPLIKILLMHGADINKNGYALLSTAVGHNNKDIVNCILQNSQPDIDQQDSEGVTALMLAAQENNCAIIEQLLAHGADINKANNNGVTALMIAANWGHPEAVQCLLRNPHIVINQKAMNGATAFMCAVLAEENNWPMIQIFLRHGVDINQAHDKGETALILAISNNDMNLFEHLVHNRTTKIDQADNKGITPLMWAAGYNNCSMIKILLERGADVNKGDDDGKTALMRAVYSGHIETVQCLFDNSHVAVNQQDKSGVTALMFAVKGKANNEPIIKILLKYGVDLNQQDINGWTALMLAISLKNKPVIQLLLNAGANPKTGTRDDLTSLWLAQRTGDKEIIDLVMKAIKK